VLDSSTPGLSGIEPESLGLQWGDAVCANKGRLDGVGAVVIWNKRDWLQGENNGGAAGRNPGQHGGASPDARRPDL